MLATIYDSWNLDAITTYSDMAKQALFNRNSEQTQKDIIDDISSIKEVTKELISKNVSMMPVIQVNDAITDSPPARQQSSNAIIISPSSNTRNPNPPTIENEKYQKFERSIDLKFIANLDRKIPNPTKQDFAYIAYRRIALAVSASQFISNEKDAEVFLREVGLKSLLIAITQSPPPQSPDLRLQALNGLNNLLKHERNIAMNLVKGEGGANLINALCDIIEEPFNPFRLRSQADKNRDVKEQYEALSLFFRMVRISDSIAGYLKDDVRLRKIMLQIASQVDDSQVRPPSVILTPGEGAYPPPIDTYQVKQESSSIFGFQRTERKKTSNSTIVLDYNGIF